MIRSACMIVLTRCATMTTAASRVSHLDSAARSRASVAASSAEKQSSNRYTRGCFTIARAIDSRWRCPPETLVPPWSIGASRPPGIAATKSRAWATSRARHSSASVAVGPAEPQVVGDRAAEQERRLRDQADGAPQLLELLIADVDAVDEHAALRGVEEPGNEVEQRRLAAPGAADDRAGLAGLGA